MDSDGLMENAGAFPQPLNNSRARERRLDEASPRVVHTAHSSCGCFQIFFDLSGAGSSLVLALEKIKIRKTAAGL